MRSNDVKNFIVMIAGVAAIYGLAYRTAKIMTRRAGLRTDEENDIFDRRDRCKEEVEEIKWKEEAAMLKNLQANSLYKETKERIFELQKMAADSKSLAIKHDDLAFDVSSGNKDMSQRVITHEENNLRNIERIVRKEIESRRSDIDKEKIEKYNELVKKTNAILKRERAGLWKEVLFGKA